MKFDSKMDLANKNKFPSAAVFVKSSTPLSTSASPTYNGPTLTVSELATNSSVDLAYSIASKAIVKITCNYSGYLCPIDKTVNYYN
jgi:hypothetical protein